MAAEFAITSSKGFHIRFDNDVIVSVQFGGGNYCDNYRIPIRSEERKSVLSCSNAEVAVFKKGEEGWLTNKILPEKLGKDVVGYQSPLDVLKVLNKASKL
jgi:hypothetical protein